MATHTEDRSYVCPYCHKTFKTSVATRKHIRTHRNEFVALHARGESEQVANGQVNQHQSDVTDATHSQFNEDNLEGHHQSEDVYSDFVGLAEDCKSF